MINSDKMDKCAALKYTHLNERKNELAVISNSVFGISATMGLRLM
jgi:hypothetical protein